MRWPAVVLTIGLSACSTLPNRHGWGEDASLTPGSERVGWGARRAARDPGTWIPAVAAAFLYGTDADKRLSTWAIKQKPVFGNNENATTISDQLRWWTDAGFFATALATPSGPPDEFIENKSKGVAVEALGVITTIGTTNLLKKTVHRTQPDGGHESFVSNHASEPFARAALVRRNTDYLGLSPTTEGTVDGVFYGIAAASAWARVEMGLHYPSDQLAGAAIGNFIALFFHDAFLGLDPHLTLGATADPVPTVTLGYRW